MRVCMGEGGYMRYRIPPQDVGVMDLQFMEYMDTGVYSKSRALMHFTYMTELSAISTQS